ncbi:MAG: dephospho-CoA kinase [Clostridia bacterium]|nr:dephospho-CoA kinase [Clostridia bacterium]
MLVIGLTGGIASGKSTVSSILRDLGAYVIDADKVGHEILEPGEEAYKEIICRFGRGIMGRNGKIDRKKLGQRVFSDEKELQRLNDITHPRIAARIEKKLERIEASHHDAVVVLEAALIIEMDMKDLVDELWVVWTQEDKCIKRLWRRDGLSREEALKRIRSQIPSDKKLEHADKVIYNTGNIEELRDQVMRLWRQRFS